MTVLGDLAEPDIDEHTAWLFVPVRPVIGPGEQIRAELHRLTDGRLALLVYTSLAALVDACGEHQSWVSFPAEWLPEMEIDRVDIVAIDLPLPRELRVKRADNHWPGQPKDWE